MKRLIFVFAALLLLGSCTRGYKMPKGFEQELRAFYVKWHEANEQPFSGPLSSEQELAMYQQQYDIVQKYGLKELAVEAGYFTEQQLVVDTVQIDLTQLEKDVEEWGRRNTTAEFQKLSKEAKRLTIDEIVENDKLLPIEKLILVEIGVVRNI